MALATRRSALVLITSALILWLAAQASAAAGEIAGCVTDATGQKLPGVTIVAKAWGVQQTVPANARGCYELTDLPPNLYRVTARLPGFDNVTRENIRIVPGQRMRLDFEMPVSALCDCLGFPPTLAALWERSDAVLHVSLTQPDAELPAPPGYFTHTAVVLDAFKQQLEGVPVGSATTVLEEQRNAAPGPYDVGQELVMFLHRGHWSPGAQTLASFHEPGTVFVIEDGRIQRAPAALSRYVGMGLDDFFAELRTMSAVK